MICVSDPAEPQVLGELPSESFEALSLDNNINYRQTTAPTISTTSYSRSKSNLDQVYVNHLSKNRENVLPNINKQKPQNVQKNYLQRQSSCKEVPEKIPKNDNIRHSISDMNISKTAVSSRSTSRKNSFSRPSRNSVGPNLTKIPNSTSTRMMERPAVPAKPIPINNAVRHVDMYVSPKISPETPPENEFVPNCVDRPVGLDMDDFLPVSLALYIIICKVGKKIVVVAIQTVQDEFTFFNLIGSRL